mmetsp:Transcript_51669/g.126815  ORF Transcript_51669/g.126815 Transcript_51669/m.126815 type:complete len:237 (+) Transcript_51669:110-820(+)|eukprot:CAMPEP_0198315026 /NCGR_PEP_ID=MMETSP1450-20131203/5448_1 /TAXON_ID=753684 ORGANISM="Madagascaria erythrocladiodes, Strain CCMP3234" /NCGR_SAMPLE_ID=MMETSP1450 /ASSEMBLY_ACC=CAM_ASM_001115 /LENGTH=236 /DNA_ID=CAMNT_0044018117 /DNA_START=98 /DNA_END=808 /DNA_ORIENTATION=-
MKYLNVPELSELGFEIAELELGEVAFEAKLEVYSCKMAGGDKKLCRSLDTKFSEEFGSTSPASPMVATGVAGHSVGVTPFGPLSEPSTRRVLINLICTLNASYPDYDFSNISVDQLTRESNVNMVVSQIDSSLEGVYHALGKSFREKLWRVIESTIGGLTSCEVYSFISDMESEDPYSELGRIWSFNFFFYNRRAKKVLFFACTAQRRDVMDARLGEEDEDALMDFNDDEPQFALD